MDCYDACQAEMIDDNIKGSKENLVTDGKLCVNFANLLKVENIKSASLEGENISLEKSLNILLVEIVVLNDF